MKKPTKLVVKISWPKLAHMPDQSVSYPRRGGYESVTDLQSQLTKRFKDKSPERIPNGVRYSEVFTGDGQGDLRVFEVTLA